MPLFEVETTSHIMIACVDDDTAARAFAHGPLSQRAGHPGESPAAGRLGHLEEPAGLAARRRLHTRRATAWPRPRGTSFTPSGCTCSRRVATWTGHARRSSRTWRSAGDSRWRRDSGPDPGIRIARGRASRTAGGSGGIRRLVRRTRFGPGRPVRRAVGPDEVPIPRHGRGRVRDMPSRVICLILGGGRGTRLYPLTKSRSKPAVPIAGKYRLIDIPISNCIHSG